MSNDELLLSGRTAPMPIVDGSLSKTDNSFTATLLDGRTIEGRIDILDAVLTAPTEPGPEPEPPATFQLLVSDELIEQIREELADPTSNRSDQWALVKAQKNQSKGGGQGLAIPGRASRQTFSDPTYAWLTYDRIDKDEQGCGFTDDGMAIFTLALKYRLEDDTAALNAVVTGALHWATHLTWFDAKTADGTARGKFWASTGVARYCYGVALVWDHFSDEEKALIGQWLRNVFMDGRNQTQNQGPVYDDAGNVIRPSGPEGQGGGSLLDERSGPNHQAIYASDFLAIGAILRETDPVNGQEIIDWGIRYFDVHMPTFIRENGPDEPVSPTNGAPYPPPPDEAGWDTLDLLSQAWWLSLERNELYETNFLGGLLVDFLIADISRDVAHAMFTMDALGQCIEMAHNLGIELPKFARVAGAIELAAKWLNEAHVECWNKHSGNWSSLDGTGWLPSLWAQHGIGTRGGSSTGGSTSPSAPTFDLNGAGSVGGGWNICRHAFPDEDMPELDLLLERWSGVPNDAGGHAGTRGKDGPAGGVAVMNGSNTTPNGSPYCWGAFLFAA